MDLHIMNSQTLCVELQELETHKKEELELLSKINKKITQVEIVRIALERAHNEPLKLPNYSDYTNPYTFTPTQLKLFDFGFPITLFKVKKHQLKDKKKVGRKPKQKTLKFYTRRRRFKTNKQTNNLEQIKEKK